MRTKTERRERSRHLRTVARRKQLRTELREAATACITELLEDLGLAIESWRVSQHLRAIVRTEIARVDGNG